MELKNEPYSTLYKTCRDSINRCSTDDENIMRVKCKIISHFYSDHPHYIEEKELYKLKRFYSYLKHKSKYNNFYYTNLIAALIVSVIALGHSMIGGGSNYVVLGSFISELSGTPDCLELILYIAMVAVVLMFLGFWIKDSWAQGRIRIVMQATQEMIDSVEASTGPKNKQGG